MSVTEYVVPLGEDARKRHYHESEKGKVIAFTVQLEVFVNDQWRVVIRYDSAHGFAHIDRYYLDGRKVKKELNLKLSEGLTLADEDIKENWKAYQKAFLEGKYMIDILETKHSILVAEFDRYVVEHPEFAEKIPQNAQIVLQIEGDDEYNEWSRQLAERQREPGQLVVYVKIKGLKPTKSRLIEPEVALT